MTIAKVRKIKNNLSCYLMSGLPILGIFLFSFLPILISVWLSFTSLKTLDFQSATFNGLENYRELFKDELFFKAIGNTFYSLLSLPLSMISGLLIAVMLTKAGIKGKVFFRALFFIPFICSTVAVAFVFRWMFDTEFGIINALLGTKINFWFSEKWFMPIMLLILTWTGTGYYIILYQAALTNVNQAALEAAQIDGAGALRRFFAITLPAVSPTTFYLLIMGIIGGLQTFTWFQVICNPMRAIGQGFGPGNNGITIVYYLYTKAFGAMGGQVKGGVAAAAAWVLSAGILILTIFNFVFSKKWVHYDE